MIIYYPIYYHIIIIILLNNVFQLNQCINNSITLCIQYFNDFFHQSFHCYRPLPLPNLLFITSKICIQYQLYLYTHTYEFLANVS